jgi:hypothetical protein
MFANGGVSVVSCSGWMLLFPMGTGPALEESFLLLSACSSRIYIVLSVGQYHGVYTASNVSVRKREYALYSGDMLDIDIGVRASALMESS